ncbi:MAG: dihydrofolate reductase family protein [Mycobacteriaceae bacterium]
MTDGIEAALALAERAAGDGTIAIACGAQTVQQYLRAGNLDVLRLHVVPVVLGAGERLLDSVGDLRWTQESVRASAGITHLTCRLSGI